MNQLLATKLFIPAPGPKVVRRPRLTARLGQSLEHKLTLVSAAAGFGKTTLLSEWISTLTPSSLPPGEGPGVSAAWLSLDEGDNDPTRFLTYFIAALQTVEARIGAGLLTVLQAPQQPPVEAILTALLNEINAIQGQLVLALDDYHAIDSPPVDQALAFLLEHLPAQMHLVIATREDPNLPLARLRAGGQLTEVRAADLRFTPAEAAEFLNQAMGLALPVEDIVALESRTEGWIAGLQLAALALQGTISAQEQPDASVFIRSFTGSHRYVLDYLVEEVLQQQAESVQNFLLRTSILERMCGPLCEAVLGEPSAPGQETLEYLERANLFIVPLDNERRWYRYHHLFGELLRQRLVQSLPPPASPAMGGSIAELHMRASQWLEANGLEIEAFQHAVLANDIDRAARLVEGEGMPLLFRGAVAPVLGWLESLPAQELDARPALWVIYASTMLFVGRLSGVEQKAQAAEAALAAAIPAGAEPDARTRDLIGHIASIRATLAVMQQDVDNILAQSRRALEYLHPNNLPVRAATHWTLGHAYHLQGDRAAARQAYSQAVSISRPIGHFIITILATLGLGSLQETENQMGLAAETYQGLLKLVGDPPLPVACEVHFGLARVYYEWNDLEAAQRHGQLAWQLARQIEFNDLYIANEVFLARLKLAQGRPNEAAVILARAEQAVRQHKFANRMPAVAAAQALCLLRQGDLAAAAQLAGEYDLPLIQARVRLAQGDPTGALAMLDPLRRQAEAKGWESERLKVIVPQALAWQALGEKDQALQLLAEALRLAEPGGLIRTFIDEGAPMARLLAAAPARKMASDYVSKLHSACQAEAQKDAAGFDQPPSQPLNEPLSPRELEVLQLIAQGLSNQEISQRLFLALDTVKGHNRRIYEKLGVQRRTEAVARARELGLFF